jgi:small-conductance mechanosensitive channel
VKSDVNRALLRALAERGVEIPFPQRVLHTRVAEPVGVAGGVVGDLAGPRIDTPRA